MSHHVVGRTEQLPSELIVNSQGTEIFSQELPRVSCAYYFTQLDPAAWKVDNAVYWINLHFVDRSLAKCQKTKQSPNIVEPTGCVRLRTFDWF